MRNEEIERAMKYHGVMVFHVDEDPQIGELIVATKPKATPSLQAEITKIAGAHWQCRFSELPDDWRNSDGTYAAKPEDYLPEAKLEIETGPSYKPGPFWAHKTDMAELGRRLHESRFVPVDTVNHPAHYNTGKIEVIEFIEDQKMNYHVGNTVKYLCRAGRKDETKLIEDLEKASWYLRRYIEKLKAEREGRDPVRPNEMRKP